MVQRVFAAKASAISFLNSAWASARFASVIWPRQLATHSLKDDKLPVERITCTVIYLSCGGHDSDDMVMVRNSRIEWQTGNFFKVIMYSSAHADSKLRLKRNNRFIRS